MNDNAFMAEAEALARRIGKLLAGKGALLQAAVLADLASTWVAGHVVPGDGAQTAALRDKIFQLHINTIRRLVALADQEGQP